MPKLDEIVVDQVTALLEGETNAVTMLANASALLSDAIADNNWCGFYLLNKQSGELDLGPFQGKVACMHIKPGTGVVGTSFAQGESLLVPNVHEFPGHIACDSASNAELVAPVYLNGELSAILDIDSPTLNRFSAEDQQIVQAFAKALGKKLDAAGISALS
ncbi:GAF domain-containing protein [Lacticaseibacillus songhuajiangensis]|uniref:GAF domain-containing protein n=1 Tax=Lacticaseibacillus songhuajiangensis TaxID=1296539 RepID=UPI0013DE1776|nr:GAF domain-containing protein [Lacticaseibacillus songhuajiangensis]